MQEENVSPSYSVENKMVYDENFLEALKSIVPPAPEAKMKDEEVWLHCILAFSRFGTSKYIDTEDLTYYADKILKNFKARFRNESN